MKILKKFTYAQWAVVVLALLTVIIPIMINYATATPPRWVKEYPWLPWAILAVLTAIFVVVSYLQSRESDSKQRQVDSYTVGSPIKEPSYFFGRSTQVEEFFTNLKTAQPQSLQVLGLRRAGKTSFLHYVSHPDVVRKNTHDAAKTLVIYIDLQTDIKTVTDFYLKLAEDINGALPEANRQPLPFKITRRAFEKWLKSPELAKYRLMILLDEIEVLHQRAAFDAEFFQGLRSLVNARSVPLAWVTSSYIDFYRLTNALNKGDKSSPFFNIFHPTPLILARLTTIEADDLIQKPAISRGIRFSTEEIISIKQLAGSLPFFLQAAAETWFKAKQQQVPSSQIKAQVKPKFASAMARHFYWYWPHFTEYERILLTHIATQTPTEWSTYRQPNGELVINDLLKYGLITQEGESYHIAGEVFAEWIRDRTVMPSLPDTAL